MSERTQCWVVFVGVLAVVGLDIYLSSIGW